MKKWMFCIVLTAVLCACEREALLPDGSDKEVEMILDFRVEGGCSTKAVQTASGDPVDGLKRVDLYFFDSGGTAVNDHVALLPKDGVFETLSFKRTRNTSISVLALGNLDPDTAEYLSDCTVDELMRINSRRGRIVLSAGNFDFDRIPMIGAQRLYFTEDKKVTVILYRLMYRIDIGKIAIDFQDPLMIGKKVVLKNIAIINTMNIFSPLKNAKVTQFGNTRYSFFGNDTDLEKSFGGVKYGLAYYPYESYNGSSTPRPPMTYDGPGKLDGVAYPEVFNSNYKAAAGKLYIDATGVMAEATSQHYSDEEGLIVAEGDMAQRHEFTVNRSFYGLFWNANYSANTLLGSTTSQNTAQKLVLEMEVDGETLFYPILLYRMQPNYIYKVDCITVLYPGSKYANFYEERYVVNLTISAEPWEVVDIENLSVGADPETGMPVPDDMFPSNF